MPVFNGGSYFELALRSALNQTYGNIEIVVVNDGSTDGGETDRLCRRYAESFDRIKYLHQDNTGVGGALNAGLAAMTGDIFCWLSHDDLFEPHKTASQVALFNRLGRADAMLISDYHLIGPEGEILNTVRLDNLAARASPRIPLYRAWINGCTLFIPRHVIKGDAPFDTQYRHVQDYRLWLELVEQHEFFHQPETLVRYRIHPGQDSQKPDAVVEGDAFWIDMMEDCAPAVRAQLSGSAWRFFDQTQSKAYPAAAAHAQARRDHCIETTLVSVLLWAGPDAAVTARALASVRGQTHTLLDILVLAPEGQVRDLKSACRDDPRVRLLTANLADKDIADALLDSLGDYVAFLDGRDLYQPHKIERQMAAMQMAGAQISHSAYDKALGSPSGDFERVPALPLNGWVDPATMSDCPIAPSTMMIHRLLVAEVWSFTPDAATSAWIEACRRRPLLALDESLTTVGAAREGGGLSPRAATAPFDPAPFQTSARTPLSCAAAARRLQAGLEDEAEMDARPHQTLDLAAGANSYKHPLVREGVTGLVFSSGQAPWDYVAAIRLDAAWAAGGRVQVLLRNEEQAYAMLVDDEFNPIGLRQPLDASPIPTMAWFDLDPERLPHALVVQAGEQPSSAALNLMRVRIFAPGS
jgi:glycosyltransferase involved in cell wall biosynthesis